METQFSGRRIAIVGPSGAGKTTLAQELSNRLGVAHVELDALHWEPNWVEADDSVFRERVDAALAGDSWTVDGNYGQVRDIVWGRADTLIWLDFPLGLVLRRIAVRTWDRWRRKEVLWGGCEERPLNVLDPRPAHNLFVWTITTHRERKRRFPRELAGYPHLRVVQLRTPEQLRAWTDSAALPDVVGPSAVGKM